MQFTSTTREDVGYRKIAKLSPLPMPNDEFDGSIVIASCWGNDTPENGATWYTLLLLNDTPGEFYRVLNVDSETRRIYWDEPYPNIIPAAEAYSETIGGY